MGEFSWLTSPRIKFKLAKNAIIPRYANYGDSGMDLHSTENVIIPPMGRKLIGTGIQVQIPLGFEGQIRSRSGLALKHGIFVLNSPGTIDSTYRGEIKVILQNMGDTDFEVKEGDRIAQIVFAQLIYLQTEFSYDEDYELDETERGEGGFGSTGV